MITREQQRLNLIARANRLENEMQLDKQTIEHWNSIHPDEKPIVVDYSELESLIAKMREGLGEKTQ